MSTSANVAARYDIPEEERPATARWRETYPELLGRLSHQSVVKHFDAYADVPWDDPEYRIDPDDPRWELSDDDWRRVIDADLTSVFLCCRAAVKVMLPQGGGRIINVRSDDDHGLVFIV